jgi:hypothetical protein
MGVQDVEKTIGIIAGMIIFIPPLPEVPTLSIPLYLQWDFWVAVATVLLDLVTLLLVFETRRMRTDSDKTMEEMRKNAERSADSAAMSAAATKALVEIGQRPWVSMQSLYLEREISSHNRAVSLTSTLLNSGATPAMKVVAHHYYFVGTGEFPDEPDYHSDQTAAPIPMTICAHKERNIVVQMAMSDEDVTAVLERSASIFVYGVITYDDGFGNRHQTRWCAKHNGGVGPDTHFSLTGKHDSID